METYISLYPKSKDESTEKDEKSSAAHHLHSSRPPMWTTIEKAREDGKSALEKIRDRRPERDFSRPSSKKTDKKSTSQDEERPAKGKYGKKEEKKGEESESEDGGFFEED